MNGKENNQIICCIANKSNTCFQASPLRLSHCNLHSNHLKSGITLVIPAVKLKQFICAGAQNISGLNSNTNTTGSNRSQHRYVKNNLSLLL